MSLSVRGTPSSPLRVVPTCVNRAIPNVLGVQAVATQTASHAAMPTLKLTASLCAWGHVHQTTMGIKAPASLVMSTALDARARLVGTALSVLRTRLMESVSLPVLILWSMTQPKGSVS